MQELLEKCHPLGMFDSISTLAVASNMRELYRLVLVDTPLAPYFSESLTAGERAVWLTNDRQPALAGSHLQSRESSGMDTAEACRAPLPG